LRPTRSVHKSEAQRYDARDTTDVLGHAVVQRQRADQGVGKHVRYLVSIENGRNLCLATPAVHAFADIEDHVPAIAGYQSPCQLLQVADRVGVIAERFQSRCNAVDGIAAIELRRVYLAVTCFHPCFAQVVGDADAQAIRASHDDTSARSASEAVSSG